VIFRDATAWRLDIVPQNRDIRDPRLGLAERVWRTRYRARLLRYWFAFNALRDECMALGRPLRVLEVGIGNGK
jgi:hypothetical protein